MKERKQRRERKEEREREKEMLSIWKVKQITRLVCIKCDGDDEAGGVRLSLSRCVRVCV